MTREREKVGEERGSAFECLYFSIHSIWLSIKVTASNHHSCNTLQHTATHWHSIFSPPNWLYPVTTAATQHQQTATRWEQTFEKLPQCATRCTKTATLQHAATHWEQHNAPKRSHCNTPWHTAIHCEQTFEKLYLSTSSTVSLPCGKTRGWTRFSKVSLLNLRYKKR